MVEKDSRKMRKETITIPPMPKDFIPEKGPQGRKIIFHDKFHELMRNEVRKTFWRKKWKIHYLQQLLYGFQERKENEEQETSRG